MIKGSLVVITHYIHITVSYLVSYFLSLRLVRLWIRAMLGLVDKGQIVLRKIGFTSWFLNFVTENRTPFILFFVIPVSFCYDIFMTVRNLYVETFLATPLLHEARVKKVQEQVKNWYKTHKITKKGKMCTARPAWQTMSSRTAVYKNDCTPIDVSLKDIISVDTKRRIVKCEPLVDMGQLSRYLLPLGWSLAIMIEMEDLTVGGCLVDIGIETNSHIYGILAETVVSYEIVLADGTLTTASRTHNQDLYHMLPFSRGTIGFLVGVELEIIPCKKYMHMTYIPCHTVQQMHDEMNKLAHAKNTPEFLEATVYSKDKSVIMAGNYAEVTTEEQYRKINPINYWYKPWFYKHVEQFLYKDTTKSSKKYIPTESKTHKKTKSVLRELQNMIGGLGNFQFYNNLINLVDNSAPDSFDEYIPLRHYIHRHTRSIFWELEELIPFGNHWAYRLFLGWLGPPKVSLLKLFTHTPEIRKRTVYEHVIQDMIVPMRYLKDSVELFEREFAVYPLLMYPIKMFQRPNGIGGLTKRLKNPIQNSNPPAEMYFDLGIYGIPRNVRQKKSWDAEKAVRSMEKFARDHNGFQMLWADTFMTKDEFEQTFDLTDYHKIRHKYKADIGFPEVWEKVKPQYLK